MSHTETPELSVIIPVWNGARYLGEAIHSVLAQKAASLEVIVVDDGSDDESASIAESYGAPVICIRMPHTGLASSRNTGVMAARGKFLLHLDADDILPSNSVSLRMAQFQAKPETDLVVGCLESFISPDAKPEIISKYKDIPPPQRGGLPGATILRASFAARVGSFDGSLSRSPDLDWMIRAQEQSMNLVFIPEVVLKRRIHGGNLSLQSNGAGARLGILRAALDRRRQSGKQGV